MKKLALLISGTVLVIFAASCDKNSVTNRNSEITSEDERLAGVNVAAGETSGPFMKLFVLNEGKLGTDNASLDFFRYSNGLYCRNTFKMMNPDIPLGLGDVGNDIKVWKNTIWMTINNSGIVEVINAINEEHMASITVPSCRDIAFYGDYAYVTSYSGAVYGGNDIKGSVYKIYIGTMSVVDSVHVGYQPEGIAEYDGKLYIANGGGFHNGYDNTLTILDPAGGTDKETLEVAKNLKDVYANGNGDIWVSSLGDYYSEHSGLYHIDGTTNTLVSRPNALKDVRVSCMTMDAAGVVYVIGTDDEWNWKGPRKYNLYTVQPGGDVVKTAFTSDMDAITAPYSICADCYNRNIYIGDAGDYLNPGKIYCFNSDLELLWSTTAGVDPGHMILYSPYYGI